MDDDSVWRAIGGRTRRSPGAARKRQSDRAPRGRCRQTDKPARVEFSHDTPAGDRWSSDPRQGDGSMNDEVVTGAGRDPSRARSGRPLPPRALLPHRGRSHPARLGRVAAGMPPADRPHPPAGPAPTVPRRAVDRARAVRPVGHPPVHESLAAPSPHLLVGLPGRTDSGPSVASTRPCAGTATGRGVAPLPVPCPATLSPPCFGYGEG